MGNIQSFININVKIWYYIYTTVNKIKIIIHTFPYLNNTTVNILR